MTFYYESQVLYAPFSYDPATIKCPAFIYHGKLDHEAEVGQAEFHHKIIPGSTLITHEEHGHLTGIGLNMERIILALAEQKSVQLSADGA